MGFFSHTDRFQCNSPCIIKWIFQNNMSFLLFKFACILTIIVSSCLTKSLGINIWKYVSLMCSPCDNNCHIISICKQLPAECLVSFSGLHVSKCNISYLNDYKQHNKICCCICSQNVWNPQNNKTYISDRLTLILLKLCNLIWCNILIRGQPFQQLSIVVKQILWDQLALIYIVHLSCVMYIVYLFGYDNKHSIFKQQ